jgi:hypothetical protein
MYKNISKLILIKYKIHSYRKPKPELPSLVDLLIRRLTIVKNLRKSLSLHRRNGKENKNKNSQIPN